MSRSLSVRRPELRFATLFVLATSVTAACSDSATDGPVGGSGGSESTASGTMSTGTTSSSTPTVVSNAPLDGAMGVATNGYASATFSEEMDPATIDPTTFTVTSAGAPVEGTVVYAHSSATFWPASNFASNSTFTATLSKGAKSAAGVGLAADHSWQFTTGATKGPGVAVDLGTAGGFVILSKSGISTVPTSAITGDLGVSPAAATYITGFSLTADATSVFSTSNQVTGRVFAADYATPTPSNLTTAIGDMQIAFTAAAARAPDATELGAGNIGGMTLTPGVYKWGTGLLIPTDVTLSGSATDVWIFQIAQDLTIANGTQIKLAGGAIPKNVFWQVAGLVDVGTTAHLQGVVLTQTSIDVKAGASVDGRLLAQTDVSLSANAVTAPAE